MSRRIRSVVSPSIVATCASRLNSNDESNGNNLTAPNKAEQPSDESVPNLARPPGVQNLGALVFHEGKRALVKQVHAILPKT